MTSDRIRTVGELESGDLYVLDPGWTLDLGVFEQLYYKRSYYQDITKKLSKGVITKITPKRIYVKTEDAGNAIFYRGTDTDGPEGRAYTSDIRLNSQAVIYPVDKKVDEVIEVAIKKAASKKARYDTYQDLYGLLMYPEKFITQTDEVVLQEIVDVLKTHGVIS